LASPRTVLVIGATGTLARPVVRQLLAAGHRVHALARDPFTAQRHLPEEVTCVPGSLEQPESIRAALESCDALYLNLPATTMSLSGFVPERDGMRNILAALAPGSRVPILKLSEIDAEHHGPFLDLRLKFESEQRIKESGHSYLLFRPTWFMESLPDLLTQGQYLVVAGWQAHPVYWVAGEDYGQMVAAALQLPVEQMSRTLTIQGPEPLTLDQAASTYRRIADPRLRILHLPLWLLGLPAAFEPRWRFNKELMTFYDRRRETFIGEEAWRLLGRPQMTVADFAASRAGTYNGGTLREGTEKPAR
jgi:uncharacterized protein YbjT (DUF2867 family)